VFSGILTVAPIVDATGCATYGGTTTSDKPPTADLRHVRVVPRSRRFLGSKVLGQLGAYYRVGEYSVSRRTQARVGRAARFPGRDPMDRRGTSPGVIVVSAENPDAPAELRQRQPLRYIPQAAEHELAAARVHDVRHRTAAETTLQLDAAGDPKYIVNAGPADDRWSGETVTAV